MYLRVMKMLAAVKQNGLALQFVPDSMKDKYGSCSTPKYIRI